MVGFALRRMGSDEISPKIEGTATTSGRKAARRMATATHCGGTSARKGGSP